MKSVIVQINKQVKFKLHNHARVLSKLNISVRKQLGVVHVDVYTGAIYYPIIENQVRRQITLQLKQNL